MKISKRNTYTRDIRLSWKHIERMNHMIKIFNRDIDIKPEGIYSI